MGYLGMVGAQSPCDPAIAPYQFVRAFRGSAFGVNFDFSNNFLVPYEIITHPIYPALFRAELHLADTIAVPVTTGDNWLVMDDSTMIISTRPTTTTHALRVVSRSGTALSLSGNQASSTLFSSAGLGSLVSLVRIDATHFARGHVTTTPHGVVQFLSVSGSTISLDATYTFPDLITPVGGTPLSIDGLSCAVGLFHAGGGYLIGDGNTAGSARRIMAHPFSGGSISATYAAWNPAAGVGFFEAGVDGSTECVLFDGSSGYSAFYFDGTNGHLGMTGTFFGDRVAGGIGYASGDGNLTDPYVDLLLSDPVTDPTPASTFEGLITQSGDSLAATPIAVMRECPLSGSQGLTRHGPGNLIAETYPTGGPSDPYFLLASTW